MLFRLNPEIVVGRRSFLDDRKDRDTFPCPRCRKIYYYSKNLKRHLKFECGKEPKFQCPHCPHKTKHKSSLQVHIGTKHPEHTMVNSREFVIAMNRRYSDYNTFDNKPPKFDSFENKPRKFDF